MNDIITRMDAYCQKYKVSNNKAAAGIGYTPSVLSQWRKGEYKGDVTAVDFKVRAWLDLQESRETLGTIPFVPLLRTERMKGAIRLIHEDKSIGLLLADSGSGKTRACEEYKIQNPSTSILIQIDPTMGLSTVVARLARELNIPAKGRLSDMSDRLVDELKRRDMAIIFDEADYMSDGVMEWARIALFDKGGAALVFVGLPSIEYRITGLRGDHRQLENRVGLKLPMEGVTASELKEVLEAVWPGLDADTRQVFIDAARKSLHILVRHVANVQRALRGTGRDMPTKDEALDAANLLMKAR
jgi:DNA transposition AAA+ family ATPase